MPEPITTAAPASQNISPQATPAARWRDLVAGLSVAGLLLPEAVAYADIANLPPQAGIIALFAGLLCYGLFGGSRFAIVSATSSSAAVLAAATASLSADPAQRALLAGGLVLLTGFGFLLAGLTRVGASTSFIARPVLQGFAFGLGLVIISRQLALIAGVHPAHSDTLPALFDLLAGARQWRPAGVALGAVSLLLLYVLSRTKRVPAALVVILLGMAAGKWLDLASHGVALVGPIRLSLQAPAAPDLSRAQWLRLAELAVALLLILYAESYGAIRAFAIKHGDGTTPNRDLLAFGAANLVSALLHGMPVGAGYSATAANEAAGAASRRAGWIAALVLFAMVATLLPGIELTPQPVLAAIVIGAVSHTLTLATFRPYFHWRRDRVVVLSSVLAVLLLGVLDGLLVAIGISLVLLLRQLSKSEVALLGQLGQSHDYVNLALHPHARALPGMLLLLPEQALFFANAERIVTQLQQHITRCTAPCDTVIVSLEESPDLDSSSLQALHELAGFVAGQQRQLIFARLKRPAYDVLARLLNGERPRPYLTELSVDDAVAAALRLRHERGAPALTSAAPAASRPAVC